MNVLWLSLILLLSAAARVIYFRVPMENNLGRLLYYGVFRKRGIDRHGESRLFVESGLECLLSLLYRLFGRRWDFQWVKAVDIVFSLAAQIAVFLLAGHFFGSLAGLMAAALLGLVLALPQMIPWGANPEGYNLFFVSLAYYLALVHGPDQAWFYGLAGISLGLAITFKWSSLLEALGLAVVVGVQWISTGAPIQTAASGLAWLAVGGCLGVGWILVYFWQQGLLKDFMGQSREVKRYKRAETEFRHGKINGWRDLFKIFLQGNAKHFRSIFPWWALALVGFAACFDAPAVWLVGIWLIIGLVLVYIQAVFMVRHWLAALAPLSVLGGAGLAWLLAETPPIIALPGLAALLVALGWLIREGLLHHSYSPFKSDFIRWQKMYQKTGLHLAARTKPDDYVFCYSWQPQTYIFADRRNAALPFFYCGGQYLSALRSDYMKHLAARFVEHPPAAIAIQNPGLEMSAVEIVTGLVYERDHTISFTCPARYRETVDRWVILLLKEKTEHYDFLASAGLEASDLWDRAIEMRLKEAEDHVAGGDYFQAYLVLNKLLEAAPDSEAAKRLIEIVCPGYFLPRDAIPEHQVALRPSITGQQNVAITQEKGQKPFFLHDTHDPLAETRAESRAWDVRGAKVVILLGMGLGYPLLSLFERISPDCRVTVIERRSILYQLSRKVMDLTEVIKDRPIDFLVGAEPEALAEHLAGQLNGQPVKVVYHRKSMALDGQYYSDILNWLSNAKRPSGGDPAASSLPASPGA